MDRSVQIARALEEVCQGLRHANREDEECSGETRHVVHMEGATQEEHTEERGEWSVR